MSNLLTNNNQVLLPKDVWSYFIPANTPYVNDAGSTSSFNFIHLTGKFIIETEIYIDPAATYTNSRYIFGNMVVNAGQRGIVARLTGRASLVLTMGNASGTYLVNKTFTITTTAKNNYIKLKFVGDGAGVTLYTDNVLNEYVAYTGAFGTGNAPATFKIGAYAGSVTDTTRCYHGGIRNFRIYNDTNLSSFYPMMDGTAIDVIGGLNGTSSGLILIDSLETERWAYFNGTNACITYGTTSTLGWMNAGTFYLDFVVKVLDTTASNKEFFSTALGTTNRGIRIRPNSTVVTLTWCNGVATTNINIASGLAVGKVYRIIVRGDGSNLYFTTYDEDGGVNTTNEPAGQAITFNTGTTTTYIPTFASLNGSLVGTYNTHCQIKNFKLYTDALGTVPFNDFSFQGEDIRIDSIGNNIGRIYNAVQIDNTYKAFKNPNSWMERDGANYIFNFGGTGTFVNLSNTGKFTAEYEIILGSSTVYKYVMSTSPGQYSGFSILMRAGFGLIFRIGHDNTKYIINKNFLYNFVEGTQYKIKLVADGVGVGMYVDGTLIEYANFTDTLEIDTATYISFRLGYDATSNTNGYLRQAKLYDGDNNLIFYTPLTSPYDFNKDVIGGLIGTVSGTINIVDIG